MEVEIVSIGDEVLSGQTINRNAAYLSQKLVERGDKVLRHTVLPDLPETIQKGVEEAMRRSELVITTGGLGPTLDDVTLNALRPLLGKESVELKNPVGKASGFLSSKLLVLPGVPLEMEKMFETEALPRLRRGAQKTFFARCYLCLLREVEVDPFLREIQEPGVEIGIYPSCGSLRLSFRSPRPVDALVEKVRQRFPTFFVGENEVAKSLHQEMITREKTLAFAESCTGGALASKIASIPDASLFFLGSVVAYSNAWKQRFLKVRRDTLKKHGAASSQTVHEMLEGLFDETDADFAAAVSGILGPSGGTHEKPVGTVYIGVAKRGEKADIGRIKAPKERSAGIEFVSQTALGALWRRLVHKTATFS